MNKIKQLLDKSWFRVLLIIILLSTIIIDIEYPKHRDKKFAEKIKVLEETNSSYKYTPFTFIELNKLVNNESIYLGDIDTTYIKDMDSLFKDSNRKDFSGIEKWNVSNVFYMSAMFQNAKYFNEDISSWDTSNVRTMWSMFKALIKIYHHGMYLMWKIWNICFQGLQALLKIYLHGIHLM